MTLAVVAIISICIQAQTSSTDRYADHSLLSEGKWVKISVKSEGVYQISRSRLASMGFSNPDKVCLYGYNLPLLPETRLEDMADDMTEIPLLRRSDGSVLFYSLGTIKWQLKSRTSSDYSRINNPYSSSIYYFLTEKSDGSNAMEMPLQAFNTSESVAPTTTFYEHTLVEADEVSIINSGRTFYEAFNYANTNHRSYTLPTPGIASQRMSLSVQFVAAGAASSTLTITADDTTYSNLTFRALSDYEYGIQGTKNVTFNKQLTESSTITLTHNRGTSISGHLDYILGTYIRHLDMKGNKYFPFHLNRTATSKIQLSGVGSGVKVLRVTSPSVMCEVEGTITTDGSFVAGVPVTTGLEEYVAIDTNSSFPEPTIVGAIANQDLHSLQDIDYVIIVPANDRLTAQAQRLADAHTQSEGMRCVVVRADQIYNEFSSGTPDATAYRRFMKMLYDKASTPADRPKNLCLFGDGVWDNRLITSNMSKLNADNYLLCYESENSLHHTRSYVLEEYFTLLADGKGVSPLKEKPDCGVGRITVATASQARSVVDKLISYINDDYAGAWKNLICMMADDGNSNIHMKDADSVATRMAELYPNYDIRKIYWDSYAREETGAGHSYTGAYRDITKQVNDGALIMNYTGHGSAYILSHEQVLHRTDFETWNSPRLPLWFHAACDVTPFDMNEESIGETALLNPVGGAMGSITTTRTVYSSQNRILNVNFMTHVFAHDSDGRKYTIGEALALAKADIVAGRMSERDSLNKCHFVLIGDPAISLSIPSYRVQLDEFNQQPMPLQSADTIGAGAIVSVSGRIVDADGNTATTFNGTLSPVVYDNMESVTCLNNAKDDVSPYIYYARTKKLYSGTQVVKDGQFTFTFPVPLDINYSNESALISFYAIDSLKQAEANGSFTDFCFGGTSPDISTDTSGPKLAITLNGVTYTADSLGTDGTAYVVATTPLHETPFFIGSIVDENGINAMGSGVGHDIMLIIDNDPNMTYNLNSYLNYIDGSWTQGTVTYAIPTLAEGTHTLLFRAWDMLNNPSSLQLQFEVVDGLQPNILSLKIKGPVRDELTLVVENDRPQSPLNLQVSVFDMTGRLMWKAHEIGISPSNYYTYTVNLNEASGHLPPGVYICRASIQSANGGAQATEEKKFLVVAQ